MGGYGVDNIMDIVWIGLEEFEEEVESEKTREEEDVDYVEPPFLDTRLGGLESSQALIRRRRSTTAHARQGKQKKSQGEEVRRRTRPSRARRREAAPWNCGGVLPVPSNPL